MNKQQNANENSYLISYVTECNTSKDRDETALIVDNKYAILNGDWFDKYKQCKSKQEQIKLFEDNYELHGGFWSNSLDEVLEASKR